MSRREGLLRHYEEELWHLRKMGAEFGRDHPEVAAQLDMADGACADPFVERLIESVAYLTARNRHSLDDSSSQVPEALLNILYPNYLCPIPSIAIAQFEPSKRVRQTAGYEIPQGTRLTPESGQGPAVGFRTCYPVTLWPLRVGNAGFQNAEEFPFLRKRSDLKSLKVLRVRLEHVSGNDSVRGLYPSRLRFFISGEGSSIQDLYEMLFEDLVDVVVVSDGVTVSGDGTEPWTMLPREAVCPVGFDPEHEVIPSAGHVQSQRRLLQEYFIFPEKFMFFDVEGLNALHARRLSAGEDLPDSFIDLHFVFDRSRTARNVPSIDRSTFRLGCTPVINLFKKVSEPIRFDQLRSEYPLVADQREERSIEIHSVETVASTSTIGGGTTVIEPYFSYTHPVQQRRSKAFWYARRVASGRVDRPGSDMMLSIVDLDLQPSMPPIKTLFAQVLCTNRDQAALLRAGTRLAFDGAAAVSQITCLTTPTRQVQPPLSGESYWRLISHLELNHLSLSSLEALKQTLWLYVDDDDASRRQQIEGLTQMEKPVMVPRRVVNHGLTGVCLGTELTLTFNETFYPGGNAYLFSAVLARFLALSAGINHFVQLVCRSTKREGIWKTWPPMVGDQRVL